MLASPIILSNSLNITLYSSLNKYIWKPSGNKLYKESHVDGKVGLFKYVIVMYMLYVIVFQEKLFTDC